MKVQITTINGQKIFIEVKDADMTILLARLRGPNAWLEAADDKRILINRDAIVSIREISQPESE